MTNFFWRKMKDMDVPKIEDMLYKAENNYVSACSRFLSRNSTTDQAWVLTSKSNELKALLLNSRSTLMPVFLGNTNLPSPDFIKKIKKKIHSIQGLSNEVLFVEKEMEKAGKKMIDFYDYRLMSLDSWQGFNPESNSLPANLTFQVPKLTDIDAIAPLQAGYEKEEVLAKGSKFNSAASRITIANIIASGLVMTASLNGKFVGKINVSGVSFTRYQIGGVYVRPEYRGMGIAKQMTREFIISLSKYNRGVTLFVKKKNIPACRLYEGLGFVDRDDYKITYY